MVDWHLFKTIPPR